MGSTTDVKMWWEMVDRKWKLPCMICGTFIISRNIETSFAFVSSCTTGWRSLFMNLLLLCSFIDDVCQVWLLMRKICYKKRIKLVRFVVFAAPQHWLQGWICQLNVWFCVHRMWDEISLTWAATSKWLDEQDEQGLVRQVRAFSSARQVKHKRYDADNEVWL